MAVEWLQCFGLGHTVHAEEAICKPLGYRHTRLVQNMLTDGGYMLYVTYNTHDGTFSDYFRLETPRGGIDWYGRVSEIVPRLEHLGVLRRQKTALFGKENEVEPPMHDRARQVRFGNLVHPGTQKD